MSEPLFKTDKEYDIFRESYIREIKPQMDELERKRIGSIIDSMNRWVD